VVPKQPPAGERTVGDWTFHYNGWWPSDFDRETYVRGSAKHGDLNHLTGWDVWTLMFLRNMD
jgi:hypothetical protein